MKVDLENKIKFIEEFELNNFDSFTEKLCRDTLAIAYELKSARKVVEAARKVANAAFVYRVEMMHNWPHLNCSSGVKLSEALIELDRINHKLDSTTDHNANSP